MKKIIAVLVIIGILSFNMVALADESITLGENEQIELLELIEKYDLIKLYK